MILNVINVSKSAGISKASGNPFAMQQLTFLGEFENISATNFNREGVGLTPIDLNVSDSFVNDLVAFFRKNFNGSPLSVDFATSVNGRGHTIVTGFTAK